MKISMKERKVFLRSLKDEHRKHVEAQGEGLFCTTYLVARMLRLAGQFEVTEGDLMSACHSLMLILRDKNNYPEGDVSLDLATLEQITAEINSRHKTFIVAVENGDQIKGAMAGRVPNLIANLIDHHPTFRESLQIVNALAEQEA